MHNSRHGGTNPSHSAADPGIGHYGPWLKHGAACVALPEDEDVLAVGLNRAVMLADTPWSVGGDRQGARLDGRGGCRRLPCPVSGFVGKHPPKTAGY